MSTKLVEMLEAEIESRVQVRVAEILAEKDAKEKKELNPSDIAPNGKFITPLLFCGKKYLTRDQVEDLFGVKYPALWKWRKKGRLGYRKLGGKIYFDYDEIKSLMGC